MSLIDKYKKQASKKKELLARMEEVAKHVPEVAYHFTEKEKKLEELLPYASKADYDYITEILDSIHLMQRHFKTTYPLQQIQLLFVNDSIPNAALLISKFSFFVKKIPFFSDPTTKVDRRDIFSALHIFTDIDDVRKLIGSIKCNSQVRNNLYEAYERGDEDTFSNILKDNDCDFDILASFLYITELLFVLQERMSSFLAAKKDDREDLEVEILEDFTKLEDGMPMANDVSNLLSLMSEDDETVLHLRQCFEGMDYFFALTSYSIEAMHFSKEQSAIIKSITDTADYKFLYERTKELREKLKNGIQTWVEEFTKEENATEAPAVLSPNPEEQKMPSIVCLTTCSPKEAWEHIYPSSRFRCYALSENYAALWDGASHAYEDLVRLGAIDENERNEKLLVYRLTGLYTGNEPSSEEHITWKLRIQELFCFATSVTNTSDKIYKSSCAFFRDEFGNPYSPNDGFNKAQYAKREFKDKFSPKGYKA